MVKRALPVLISLALVLSFSACNKNGTIEESQEPTRTPIPVIDDGLPDLDAEVLLRQVNPNIDAMDDEYPYLESWSDVIYDKFGVDVKVSFLPVYKVMKETIEELYVYDFLRVNPQEGMLLHELTDVDISYNIMKSLMEDGGILPMTDYIKNSQFYGSFDSDLLNLMTDDNGDIWGVPIDTAQSMFETRGYKKSWLEAKNLQVPYTTDEFYEVMSAFTYGDPDGNGQDDTFGYFGPNNFKFALNDVLKAYGMYNGSSSLIAYNPNTGTIEDSLLSPDASTALNFINKFYVEKLVRKSGLSPGVYSSAIPDNCGSIFWVFTAEDNIEYAGVPLTATNTANLVNVTTYGRVYFMLSGTENPESMFNSFVKLFYGNEEAYLMLKYGIPGRHFEIDDVNRAVIVNNKSITNENIGKIVIGSGLSVKGDLLLDLAGTLGTFPADDYRIFYNELIADADIETHAAYQRNQKQAYINQIVSSTYRVPTNAALFQSEFIDNWTIKLKDDYSYYRDLEQAVIGERIMSVDDALEAYSTNMKRLGMQELIDEANLNLGKTSVYKY